MFSGTAPNARSLGCPAGRLDPEPPRAQRSVACLPPEARRPQTTGVKTSSFQDLLAVTPWANVACRAMNVSDIHQRVLDQLLDTLTFPTWFKLVSPEPQCDENRNDQLIAKSLVEELETIVGAKVGENSGALVVNQQDRRRRLFGHRGRYNHIPRGRNNRSARNEVWLVKLSRVGSENSRFGQIEWLFTDHVDRVSAATK